jgi:hypothetical protein
MVAKTSPRFEREDDDAIPVVGWHKGVPLEDEQSDARLGLVRAEIDHVLGMSDAVALADWADDPFIRPRAGSSPLPWPRASGPWPRRTATTGRRLI